MTLLLYKFWAFLLLGDGAWIFPNTTPSLNLISENGPVPEQRHIGKFAQINLATKGGSRILG